MINLKAPTTLGEIALALGISKEAARKKAKDGNWVYSEKQMHGKNKLRLYALKDIQSETMQDVLTYRMKEIQKYEQSSREATGTTKADADIGNGGGLRAHSVQPERSAIETDVLSDGGRGQLLANHDTGRSNELISKGQCGQRDGRSIQTRGNGANQADGQRRLDIDGARAISSQSLDGDTARMDTGRAEKHAIAIVDPVKTDDKQRKTDGARQYIVNFVNRFDGSEIAAVKFLNAGYAGSVLHFDLQDAYEHCNDKKGQKIKPLSLRTVQRWAKLRKDTGSCLPKKTREKADWRSVWWLALFLSFYRKPQKPSLREAHRDFEKAWQAQGFAEKCPDYDVIYRLQKKIPQVVLAIGRSTGSELAALRPFTRRDWSGMSNEVWVGDGHTFKAKVRHPDHGQPFAPEVTFIIDAASRFIVGWAFSLSENQIAVSEALGKGMLAHGKPLIYYSDNGSGQTAKIIDCPVGGMLARLGVEHETGRPGNPQGRGIIEGLWDITTIAVAKTFPTFQGTGMDGDTLRKNTQAINRAKTKGEVPEFVPSWSVFMEKVEARIHWYNTEHQHSALGGRTPAEVYRANFDDSWHCPLTEDEVITLYRPFEIRTPFRGEVRWNNNIYFNPVLVELPANSKVRVAYDLSDAKQVWVSDLDGRLICIAEFEANKTKGFAVSVIDSLKEKRIDGMTKRGQATIDKANAERGNVIDGEVLQRIEYDAPEIIEPLKIVQPDFAQQQPEEQRLSYLETMQKFMDDGQRAVGNE